MPEASQPDVDDEPVLNDSARALFQPFTFATLSTTNPNGSPQVTMVAAFLDGEGSDSEVVLFHRGWRLKLRNIQLQAKVALTIVPFPGQVPVYPPQYFVLYGVARVEEGDAGVWSDRLALEVGKGMPPGTTMAPAFMPDNGGYTTRITPTKVRGFGPWAKMMLPPGAAMLPPGAAMLPPGSGSRDS